MGRIYEKQSDPPGQKCKYILPGNVEKETYRLSTFIKFPQTVQVDPISLAAHGFLYTGYKDRVKCFSCGANVLDWASNDDPNSAKWHFEGCELVLGNETRNVQIGFRELKFTGRFEKSRSANRVTTVTSPQESQSQTNSVETNLEQSTSSVETLSEELNAIQILDNKKSLSSTMNIRQLSSSNSSNGLLLKTCENSLNSLGLQRRTTGITRQPDSNSDNDENLQQMFPCLSPINPQMRDESDRESTFDGRWPREKVLASPKQIAKAGFYFLGDRDRAKCWYCNGGLQNWSYQDEPFTEHAKWFPGCEFILYCKGFDFVKQVVARFPHLKRPALRSPRFDHVTLQLIPARIRQTARGQSSAGSVLRDFQPSNEPSLSQNSVIPGVSRDIYERITSLGFDENEIKSAAERWFKKNERSLNSFHELLEELLTDQIDKEEQTNDETSLKRNNEVTSVNDTCQGEVPLKKSKSSTDATQDLKKTLMELEAERLCRVCNNARVDCVVMMCGHLAVCYGCSAALKRCPICGVEVSEVIRAYLS